MHDKHAQYRLTATRQLSEMIIHKNKQIIATTLLKFHISFCPKKIEAFI